MRAIAELGTARATAPVAPPAAAPVMEPATAVPIATAARPPLVSAAPEAARERRHVTVMFCDLVDFDKDRRDVDTVWRVVDGMNVRDSRVHNYPRAGIARRARTCHSLLVSGPYKRAQAD